MTIGKRESVAKKLVAEREVDGWVGDWQDVLNGHKVHRDDKGRDVATVMFRRHVPVTEET